MSRIDSAALARATPRCFAAGIVCAACGSREAPNGGQQASPEPGAPAEPAAKPTPRKIAVIPKGTTHEFWKSVHAGANKAGKELGVEIIWKGPVREDDRDEQIKVVENFVASGVDAHRARAARRHRAGAGRDRRRAAQGIPVVIIDSDIKWDGRVSFVATDNYKGGELAAKRLGELLGGKGKVIVLRYQEGSASTAQREAGFIDTITKTMPGIELVSSNQYGGATTETAYKTSRESAGRSTSRSTACSARTSPPRSACCARCRTASAQGKVKFVGFDASAEAGRSAAAAIRSTASCCRTRSAWVSSACTPRSTSSTASRSRSASTPACWMATHETMADSGDQGLAVARPRPMAELAELLVARGISKRFGAQIALSDVDLSVARGEVHALVGENGAGKSTLIKVLAGAIAPDAGSIEFDGRPFAPRDPLDARRAGIAVIYQELSLAPRSERAGEPDARPRATPRGLSAARRDARARAAGACALAARRTSRPSARWARSVRARASWSRSRARSSPTRKLVIMDEPTSSLGSADVDGCSR